MKRSAFLLLLLAVLVPSASAGMCPLCRQTLAMGGSDGLIQGFYWSILLIAGMPLLIISVATGYWHYMSKKIKKQVNDDLKGGNL